MSDAEWNFVQVMSTVLVGTLIAYAVDLRHEQDDYIDYSHRNPALRAIFTVAIWWDRLIPFVVILALVLLIMVATVNALTLPVMVVIGCATVLSVVGLAGGPLQRIRGHQ